jgi:hypothetical protein
VIIIIEKKQKKITINHMIKLIKQGEYQLIETKGQTKILILDGKKTYAWVNVKQIGEILVTSHKEHKTDQILCLGNYRIYSVVEEPKLSDQMHLELSVGKGQWQGYLLLTGLPTNKKKRNRIIPTKEVISMNTELK